VYYQFAGRTEQGGNNENLLYHGKHNQQNRQAHHAHHVNGYALLLPLGLAREVCPKGHHGKEGKNYPSFAPCLLRLKNKKPLVYKLGKGFFVI